MPCPKLFDSKQLLELNQTVIFQSTDINLITCHVSSSVLVYMRSVFEAVYHKMVCVIFPLTTYSANDQLHSVIMLKIYFIDKNLESYSDTILNINFIFPCQISFDVLVWK